MNLSSQSASNEALDSSPWGQYTLVDAHGCDLSILGSLDANRELSDKICDLLDLDKVGNLLIHNFGGSPPDPRIHGPSFIQTIDKGVLQGHCPTHPRLACIDILVNKQFNSDQLADLVRNFFKADNVQTLTVLRGIPDSVPKVINIKATGIHHTSWKQKIHSSKEEEKVDADIEMNNLFYAFIEKRAWGQFTYIDLFNCNPAITGDKKSIQEFNSEICRRIDATRFGEPILDKFGTGESYGISFAQLIETSLVQGHFPANSKSGMVDIFSCKQFDCRAIAEYVAGYFEAESYSTATILRGAPDVFPNIWHNLVSSESQIQWTLEVE